MKRFTNFGANRREIIRRVRDGEPVQIAVRSCAPFCIFPTKHAGAHHVPEPITMLEVTEMAKALSMVAADVGFRGEIIGLTFAHGHRHIGTMIPMGLARIVESKVKIAAHDAAAGLVTDGSLEIGATGRNVGTSPAPKKPVYTEAEIDSALRKTLPDVQPGSVPLIVDAEIVVEAVPEKPKAKRVVRTHEQVRAEAIAEYEAMLVSLNVLKAKTGPGAFKAATYIALAMAAGVIFALFIK